MCGKQLLASLPQISSTQKKIIKVGALVNLLIIRTNKRVKSLTVTLVNFWIDHCIIPFYMSIALLSSVS